MNESISALNKSEGFSIVDFFPSSTKININRHISLHSPSVNSSKHNILQAYINNNKLMKKENNNNDLRLSTVKRGKSIFGNLNISSNNPSTYETSFSNSIFDMISPQIKNLNVSNISNISSQKILVHLRPKSDINKFKLDIILGYAYILSKEKENKKRIEKFIFKTQKKFDEKMEKFTIKNQIETQIYNKSKSLKANKNSSKQINEEIKRITKIFHKLENMISIYGLIIYYLIKSQKKYEAKLLYLLIIKQNLNYIKYLENIINFNALLTDKNGKIKINMYRYANLVLLKIYSFFIKYGFLFNLSFYGNLFTKMYLSLSHKYYLYSISNGKNKYSTIESIKKTKIWFTYLNYYSAYFSVAHFSPMKIPIYLYNTALNIYNSIEEQQSEEKYFSFYTKYNKSLLLYVNGESDEAINVLKDIKINLFTYIVDNIYPKEISNTTVKKNKNSSFMIQEIASKIQKKDKNNQKVNKKSISTSFNKLFDHIISNKNSKNNSSHNIKQLINVNMKLEPFFISNTSINIENFVEKYLYFYGKSTSLEQLDNKDNLNPNNKKQPKPFSYSSYLRQSTYQANNIDKNNHNLKLVPNIFKNPILIKSELLIAEIELDKKRYRVAYTFTNHALAIITLLKKLQVTVLLNKYKEEQKYIKEFLNIINNVNIITESDFEEKEESEEKENGFDKVTLKTIEYKKEIELKERINLNKKVLKELEKFFIFFMNLSVYQIKVLNETQPKGNMRNFLPILFQNQFKDCLTLSQNVALEKLDIMCLSRYMILKDPNKPIFPDNLNISLEYFEKPELLGYNYMNLEELKRKVEDDSNLKANNIFKQILQATKVKENYRLKNLINDNHNLVITIIKKSKKEEIKDIMENPQSLIKPIKKFGAKYKNQFDLSQRPCKRQKSLIINVNNFSKENIFGINTEGNVSSKNIKGKLIYGSFTKDNNKYFNGNDSQKRNILVRNSLDKSSIVSRNMDIKEKKLKKNKNLDSYNSSYKLSLLDSNSNGE